MAPTESKILTKPNFITFVRSSMTNDWQRRSWDLYTSKRIHYNVTEIFTDVLNLQNEDLSRSQAHEGTQHHRTTTSVFLPQQNIQFHSTLYSISGERLWYPSLVLTLSSTRAAFTSGNAVVPTWEKISNWERHVWWLRLGGFAAWGDIEKRGGSDIRERERQSDRRRHIRWLGHEEGAYCMNMRPHNSRET